MVGFESARLTYSDLEVDLSNSGINQILSVAAVRGHRVSHFSMADLHERDGEYVAMVSSLELDPTWDRADPFHAFRTLVVADRSVVPLSEFQLLVVRGDDIRSEQTENLEILRWASGHAKMLESVEATFHTTDKYAPLERAPQLPHPGTYVATTLAQAQEAIGLLPREGPYFVLKDRYGYGGGA